MADKLFENNENDKGLDINYVINIIQQILDKAHTNVQKRQIVIRPNEQNPKEISMACPLCGDSKNRMNQKRGHLFIKNFFFVCYNERETDSMSFTKLCEKFNIQLDPEKKMQIYDYLSQNMSFSSKEDFSIDTLDKLIDAKEYMDFLNDKKGSFLSNISPIRKDSLAFTYLRNRKITNYTNILSGILRITDRWKEPVIIILNRRGNKLLGFQIRNLKDEKDKRIYKEHEFEYLYNYKNVDNQLDELEAISYNKLSHLFNILNVDFNLPVNAFEGYLDSIFFPNSISLLGLDTDTSVVENDSIDLRFVFDNDEPGLRKAKKMLLQGKTVFLWRKLYDDLAKGNYAYRNELNNIKDINKLVQFLDNSNIYYDLNLENYFSKDQFDMIYLEDKPRKVKTGMKTQSQSSEWDNIVL
jgi:hypothetical protein